MSANTIKKSFLQDSSISSIISANNFVFHVKSKFDKAILSEILFSMANEKLTKNYIPGDDKNFGMTYNIGEGNCHIDA